MKLLQSFLRLYTFLRPGMLRRQFLVQCLCMIEIMLLFLELRCLPQFLCLALGAAGNNGSDKCYNHQQLVY